MSGGPVKNKSSFGCSSNSRWEPLLEELLGIQEPIDQTLQMGSGSIKWNNLFHGPFPPLLCCGRNCCPNESEPYFSSCYKMSSHDSGCIFISVPGRRGSPKHPSLQNSLVIPHMLLEPLLPSDLPAVRSSKPALLSIRGVPSFKNGNPGRCAHFCKPTASKNNIMIHSIIIWASAL